MNDRFSSSVSRALAFVAIVGLGTAACGGPKAEGHSYSGGGGVVRIEFKPDGKAFLAMGPISTPCTYSESGKALTLTCEGETTEFTVDADGALIGPPDGMLARLTQDK